MIKIGIFSNKAIAVYLYSIFFLYEMFGVMIHQLYGFGFFWWPIQMYAMLILSFIYIANLYNLKQIKNTIISLGVFNLYVITMLTMQIIYLFYPDFYSAYMIETELLEILTETILWYMIAIVMAMNYKNLLRALSLRYLFIVYLLLVFFFFMYIIKLNLFYGAGVDRALWLGANFPSEDIELFLSGYVRGFHLYFSPLFAIYSLLLIAYLQKARKYNISYIVFFITIYILFLASGRGSLLVFMLTFTIFFTQRKIFIYMTILILVMSVVGAPILDLLAEKNERLYNLLTFNLKEDSSSAGRLEQLRVNLEYIQNNLLTGGIRSYYTTAARNYIHNTLNVLQEYGIVTFIFLVMFYLRGSFLLLFKSEKHDGLLIAKAIFFYTLIEAVLFKSIHEVKILIPMLIAYGFLSSHRSDRHAIRAGEQLEP